MKLKPPEPKLPPSPLRLNVPGKLMAGLEDYARYYESEHGQAIPMDEMVVEILGAFIAKDFAFSRWRKVRSEPSARRSVPTARATVVPS